MRPTENLLKILESYAQELEMALDDATKGDMDAEYAAVSLYRILLTLETFHAEIPREMAGDGVGKGPAGIAKFDELVRIITGI